MNTKTNLTGAFTIAEVCFKSPFPAYLDEELLFDEGSFNKKESRGENAGSHPADDSLITRKQRTRTYSEESHVVVGNRNFQRRLWSFKSKYNKLDITVTEFSRHESNSADRTSSGCFQTASLERSCEPRLSDWKIKIRFRLEIISDSWRPRRTTTRILTKDVQIIRQILVLGTG